MPASETTREPSSVFKEKDVMSWSWIEVYDRRCRIWILPFRHRASCIL